MLRGALALIAWIAILAAPAEAGWLAPLRVSPLGQQVITPGAAVGADGRMIVAWNGTVAASNRIQVAMRPPGGALEDAQLMSAPSAGGIAPRVLIDAQGNALIMWEEGLVYRWAVRPVGATTFGAVGTITLPVGERPSSELRLAAAPDGTLAAVGITLEGDSPDTTTRLRVMTRAPGGDFVLAPALDEGQESMGVSFSFDQIDMDADGQGGFYASWTKQRTSSPTTTSDVHGRHTTAGRRELRPRERRKRRGDVGERDQRAGRQRRDVRCGRHGQSDRRLRAEVRRRRRIGGAAALPSRRRSLPGG